MFERTREAPGRRVRITVNGAEIEAWEGEPLAGTLLAAGYLAVRSTLASDAPRGPFCMMGVCFECLVTVDGTANVQACATPVREGMAVIVRTGENGA